MTERTASRYPSGICQDSLRSEQGINQWHNTSIRFGLTVGNLRRPLGVAGFLGLPHLHHPQARPEGLPQGPWKAVPKDESHRPSLSLQ
jgi:hypothetical protein